MLVNNAGIGAQGTVADNDDDEWLRVLDVNVVGMARVSAARAAAPAPLGRRPPSSTPARSRPWTACPAARALHRASKGAVLALTLAMAADHVREGIRVNCVSPGHRRHALGRRLLAAAEDPEAERGRAGRPPAHRPAGRRRTEVAQAIVYLASPRSGSVTGTSLAVDGGMSGFQLPS